MSGLSAQGPRIAILGGGYAGMAAAVTLAQHNAPCVLFEAARTLGGRARRVEVNGLALDNGLHILLGAYRETLRLLRLVGEDGSGLLRQPLNLHIAGAFSLRAPPLPAPLHLAVALMRAHGPDWKERAAAARFMWRMRRSHFHLDEDCSVAQLLQRHRQSSRLRNWLWEPLCTSALNTRPEEASAQVFLNVLRDSLNARRSASDLLLPRRDLSALFPERAANFAQQRGAQIRLGQPVLAVERVEQGYLVLSAAGPEHFAQVICALPPYRVSQVIHPLPALNDLALQLDGLAHEPIWSVYLQYPPAVALPRIMLGFDGATAQWAFDRGKLAGEHGLIGVVISARGMHQQFSQDEVARRVHQDLRAQLPLLPEPLWTRVIAEKRATISCRVGLQRPPQRTVLPGFYLAGDYTASDYPPTLESAVESGVACATMAARSA